MIQQKNAIITGSTGQDGSYLDAVLLDSDKIAVALGMRGEVEGIHHVGY